MTGILEQVLAEVRALRAEFAESRSSIGTAERQVTIAEYARQRSISTSTVRKAIREERLRCIRVGRAVRVPADAEIGSPSSPTRAPATATRAARVLGLVPGRG